MKNTSACEQASLKALQRVNISVPTVPCRLSCVGCLNKKQEEGRLVWEPFNCLCFLSGGDIPILIGQSGND